MVTSTNFVKVEGGPPINGCIDSWSWDKTDKSPEVRITGNSNRSVYFHPNWSNGTAGVRATHDIRQGRCYWEIQVSERLFGTSMMFGIGTKKARLHSDSFVNLVGEDCEGWGLSHKGLLWHDGKCKEYIKPFRENVPTVVGMLYNGEEGTLTYYRDGLNLGVAFTGLDRVAGELFPMVSSTAARTTMTLANVRRDFISLQDRCRNVIVSKIRDVGHIEQLVLPPSMKQYIRQARQKYSSPQQCHTSLVKKTAKFSPLDRFASVLFY